MRLISRVHYCLAVVAALILLATQFGHAAEVDRVSGTYEVVRKASSGPHAQVELRIQLLNRGSRDYRIQRLILWDSSHAGSGASGKCSILLRAGGSVSTTQQFTLSSAEPELWKRGGRPRLVVEFQGPSGRAATEVVRLDRTSSGRAN